MFAWICERQGGCREGQAEAAARFQGRIQVSMFDRQKMICSLRRLRSRLLRHSGPVKMAYKQSQAYPGAHLALQLQWQSVG